MASLYFSSTDFVEMFLVLKCLIAYFNYDDLKSLDEADEVITSICNTTVNKIIPSCNAETVSTPVEMLQILVKPD